HISSASRRSSLVARCARLRLRSIHWQKPRPRIGGVKGVTCAVNWYSRCADRPTVQPDPVFAETFHERNGTMKQNRRQFLRLAGTATAAFAVGGLPLAADGAGEKLKIGVIGSGRVGGTL